MRSHARVFRWLTSAAVLAIVACGGGSLGPAPKGPAPNYSQAQICNCIPEAPTSSDYRHDAKHVPLPSATGQAITVADILGWPQGPAPAGDAPRSGRELQEFSITNAWLQLVWEYNGDCDIHFEISDSPSKSAPRVIVETPVDSEYCPARQHIQQQLAAQGITVSTTSTELPTALPVQVVGLAFQDFKHQRGSKFVATVWELHPAIVIVIGQ